jgi:hypothetical protein
MILILCPRVGKMDGKLVHLIYKVIYYLSTDKNSIKKEQKN